MSEIKDLIEFYMKENSIIDRYRNQCLNIFPKIVNNSMFDAIIFSKEKNIDLLKKILKCSVRNNDVDLTSKVCQETNNLYISAIDKYGSYINCALNYNSFDVFVYFYNQNIPKKLFLFHPFINPKLFKFLLEKKDKCLNYHFFSMVLSYITEVSTENVKLMIEYKIDLKQENNNSNEMLPKDESLMFLASNLNIQILNLIYQENYVNSNKKTILHNAIKKENYFIVKYLIEEKKQNINAKDCNLTTPLHIACKNSNEKIVKFLIENGATFSIDRGNRTPIYYAVINNNIEILKILIENNADVNYIDYAGNNLLEYANKYDHYDIINFLIENYKWSLNNEC